MVRQAPEATSVCTIPLTFPRMTSIIPVELFCDHEFIVRIIKPKQTKKANLLATGIVYAATLLFDNRNTLYDSTA